MTDADVGVLYGHRFKTDDQAIRERMWKISAERIFQPYVRPADSIVDIGSGRCELINALRARTRYAVDPSPETRRYRAASVNLVAEMAPGGLLKFPAASINVITACYLLEHVDSRETALRILRAARRVLQPDGRLILLQPNIRYAHKVYWDYLDHIIPWSHESLTEALELTGFRVEFLHKRFLPYSTRHAPKWPWALHLYLRCPPAWWWFGKQMLVVARPT